DPGGDQALAHPGQRQMVAHIPADQGDPVGLARADDDARVTLVHPQIQRVVVRAGAGGETEHVEGQGAPALHVVGDDLDVAEGFDVSHENSQLLVVGVWAWGQIIARSGPCGSGPSALSAAAWKTVLGEWIAWCRPACMSRQYRCSGLSMRSALPPHRA